MYQAPAAGPATRAANASSHASGPGSGFSLQRGFYSCARGSCDGGAPTSPACAAGWVVTDRLL